MRKISACLLAAMLSLGSVNALAATTDLGHNDVHLGLDNSVVATGFASGLGEYSTVIIKNDDTSDIAYINQNATGFSEVTSFMLKPGIAEGKYTATFGNEFGDTKTLKFTVGDINPTKGDSDETISLDTANKMIVSDEAMLQSDLSDKDLGLFADRYRKAFLYQASYDNASKMKTLYFVSSDGSKCYGCVDIELPTNLTGEGDVYYAIQIFNIESSQTDMNLYIGEVLQ